MPEGRRKYTRYLIAQLSHCCLDVPALSACAGGDQGVPGAANVQSPAGVYAACQRFVDLGYPISRPPRDGRMAFVRSPDLVSVELLQRGDAKPPAEPWSSMPNVGEW